MKAWLNKLFAKALPEEVRERLSQALQDQYEPLTQQVFADWLVSAQINPLGGLSLVFEVPFPAQSLWSDWREQLIARAKTFALAVSQIDFVTVIKSRQSQASIEPIVGVSNVIAVASGKGGVGKSTTAVNLALALAGEGAKVGILDADIYGPSMPLLLGLSGERPYSNDGKTMEPLEKYGVKVNSIGFLIEADSPMIWRGPVLTGSLMQLLNETNWGNLDFLVVDLPPGTGDAQLTLAQKIPVAGSLIVTTPQDLALLDARKGYKMFEKVNIPVLGLVENMAVHICSQCGHVEHIFGQGGGEKMARDFELPLLASLPLDMSIRQQADGGRPSVVADPQGSIARAYRDLAHRLSARLANRPQSYANKFGKIEVKSVS